MQNTCVSGYLIFATQGLGVSSDWHDYIGMVIFLAIVTLGVLICVFRRYFARIFGADLTDTARAAQQKKGLARLDATVTAPPESRQRAVQGSSIPATVAYKSVSTTETPTASLADTKTGNALPAWLNPASITKPQSIAYDFIKGEIAKAKPDFDSFRNVLSRFSAGWEIQNGWATLVFAHESQDKMSQWLKNQCAIEGLSHFCEKGVTTWDKIIIDDDVPQKKLLQPMCWVFADHGDEETMTKILHCLMKIYGKPGDPIKSKDELQRIEIEYTEEECLAFQNTLPNWRRESFLYCK